nr:MAG: hypothetical protein [Chemarfal virus 74]
MVGILFQESANEFASAQASLNTVMKLNNCVYHPLIGEFTKFILNGDDKYGLGMKIGGIQNLFKIASKEAKATNSNLVETLDLA